MAHKALGICLTLLCASTAVYARPQGGDVVGGAHPFEQGKGSRSDAVIIDDMVDLGDLSANLPGGECVKNPPADAITIGVGISEAGVKVTGWYLQHWDADLQRNTGFLCFDAYDAAEVQLAHQYSTDFRWDMSGHGVHGLIKKDPDYDGTILVYFKEPEEEGKAVWLYLIGKFNGREIPSFGKKFTLAPS